MPEIPSRTPIASAPLSVVLPGRNAAAYLAEVLAEWTTVLGALSRDYEILFVDDGSGDETPQLVQALPTPCPRLEVLRLEQPQGFGAALRLGLTKAQYPLVCYCPADRQYQPSELLLLLKQIDQLDLVTGHRQWLPKPLLVRGWSAFWRGFCSWVFGIPAEPPTSWTGWTGARRWLLARTIFALRFQDVECSFRLFRREILQHIPIQSAGSLANLELLAKANFTTCPMTEVAVSYRPIGSPADGYSASVAPFSWGEIWTLLNRPEFQVTPPAVPPPPEPTPAPPAPAVQ